MSTKFMQVFCDGTILAGFELLRQEGLDPKAQDMQVLSDAYKAEIKKQLDGLIIEWRAGVDSNLSSQWMQKMVNAQCIQIARTALKDAGLLISKL
jgi:hypothetical protein